MRNLEIMSLVARVFTRAFYRDLEEYEMPIELTNFTLCLLWAASICAVLAARPICAQQINPGPWRAESQRADIAPKSWREQQIRFQGESTLALAGDGKDFANGCWTRTVEIDPNVSLEFITYFKSNQVEESYRSVLARIIWQDQHGKQIERAEYPATAPTPTPGGWSVIRQVYQSPAEVRKARLELVYRWDADGTVYFGGTSLKPIQAQKARLVRLASVHHRPRHSQSSQENLEQFAALVDQAGQRGADIVCLPEGVTVVGTGKSYVSVSEPIPGPSTAFLGEVAARNGLYIVAGLYERDGQAVYNTAVLIDRHGAFVGKYRKVCLPREEIDGGITPGDVFPTFKTDFGRIGMMICWDVAFPEPARALAMGGAEVILMPIWGGNLTLTQARAIENQVYLVSSTYNMKSAVFDQEGTILAEGTLEEPVVIVEVDLNQQKLWPWLGDLKNRIRREMPPRRAISADKQ